jgi:uncharacterized protein (TIGR02246 family)
MMINRMRNRLHIGVLLAALLAVDVEAAPAAKVRERSRASVRRADVDRCAALAARDLDRFLPLLADDAAFFPDGMPVSRGKEAVRTLLAPYFDAKGPAMRCAPEAVEMSRSADLAYVTGTYDVTGTAAQRSPTGGHGKYVTIWRRRKGGAWKLVLAIDNTQPPPEPDFGPPPIP